MIPANECQVTFQPIGRRIDVPAGTTLLEAGRRAGLLFSGACCGVGLCGRCRVSIITGGMYAPNFEEEAFLKSKDYGSTARLACSARVASSVVIEIPSGSVTVGQRLHVEGEEAATTVDPLIRSHQIVLELPSLIDVRSDYARVAAALARQTGRSAWTMRPAVARQLPIVVNEHGSRLTVFTRGEEIVGFARSERAALGLAVDVGCTKIAAYLVELNSGKQLAAMGLPNPQIAYGEDLITRLVYAAKSEEQADTIATLVRDSIAAAAGELCDTAGERQSHIADVAIVGNTAMLHLLLRLPVLQLLHAPFVAAIDRDLDIPASELGWRFAPGACVQVLPSIGGFVGADHVAMILAQGIDRANKVTLALDIGTNTEIVVRDPHSNKSVSTSVPSGPVFEGGHIRDGMRAASGAIDRVSILNGELKADTIDDIKPVGICGSGVLDAIAELRNAAYIDERGHLLLAKDSRVTRGPCGLQFLLVPASETGHGRDIVLTQHDITQVQLAKAAISAAIDTLLHVADLSADSIDEVIVAGAFGTFLNLQSAIAIGLLPRLPGARYQQVGNAAGIGAKMALISKSERERACAIARGVTKIELKQYPLFDRLMARATRFPRRSDS